MSPDHDTIFISYRRSESQLHTLALYHRLQEILATPTPRHSRESGNPRTEPTLPVVDPRLRGDDGSEWWKRQIPWAKAYGEEGSDEFATPWADIEIGGRSLGNSPLRSMSVDNAQTLAQRGAAPSLDLHPSPPSVRPRPLPRPHSVSAATPSDPAASPAPAPDCVDVLIAGAGPTGLSTALALAPLGLRVRLVDPQDAATLADPPPDGRELALTHRTEALLRDWGVWDRLPAAARAPLHAAAVSTGGQAASLHLDASHARSTLPFPFKPPFPLPPLPRLPVPSILRDLIGPGAPGVASAERLGTLVSQNALRRALWQRCAEFPERITVSECTRLEDFRRDADGVTVTLAGPYGPRQVRAALLVAADGRLSGARRMAGLVADLHDFGRSAIVGRLRHTRPHDAVAREAFHLGHTLAVLPLADAPDDGTGRPLHQSSFVVTAPSELARQWMAQPIDDYARTVAGWLGGQLGDLAPAPGEESRRHLYPLVATWAPRLVSDRVALVGDAAVGMHPVTAHGFNLGLYSAETLARHLKARARGGVVPDPADPVALAAYDREHRDTARWIFHGTNAIVRLFTDDRPAARRVRQATLHLAERLPPVKALIVRQLVDA